MNILEMSATAFKAVMNFVGSGGKLVSHEVKENRLSICRSNGCGKYNAMGVCMECKCLLQTKTWLPLEKCPLDLWGIEEGVTDMEMPKCGSCDK